MQTAYCKVCERARLGRAIMAAGQTPGSSSGSVTAYQEPWRRFTSGPISKSTLNRLKVAELRDCLQERGLSTQGLKNDLVERMHAHMHEQGEAVLLIDPMFFSCALTAWRHLQWQCGDESNAMFLSTMICNGLLQYLSKPRCL